jgi:putative ABC transport system permease protein
MLPQSRTLWKVGWRYLLRHPGQSILMILGITLGVAVAVSVDLANASASRAFSYSTDAVAGRATHQIVSGPGGLDESVYVALRRDGILGSIPAAPVLSAYVTSPDLGGRTMQLLGIDPFAEAPFRGYLWEEDDSPVKGLTEWLTRPGAVLLSAELAQRLGLEEGDSLSLDVEGYRRTVFVVGLLRPADALSRQALDGLLLADIATAQELTGRLSQLDRIDLILAEDEAGVMAKISGALPPRARLQSVQARLGTIEEMTAAFRLNLFALSLLALVVGLFLIYNTMTFSVVQRRSLFGTLRCIGVTRREVFWLVVGEAALVGAVGAGLGVGLGVLMGQTAVRLVTQTINDLYFVVTVQDVAIPQSSLLKGALVGFFATIAVAAPPAWEAASVPARAALLRSGLESKARQMVMGAAAGGAILGIAGTVLLAIPSDSLTLAFSGTFAVVVGFSMLTPLTTSLLMRGSSWLFGRMLGALGRMAPRNVSSSLSRTAVAVAALMVAVSVTIGVSLMISSFRHTVVVWLDQVLQGDVYISAPSINSTQATTPLDPLVVGIASDWASVTRVDLLRTATVGSPDGPVTVYAVDNPQYGQRPFVSAIGPPSAVWSALKEGAVVVSEPFANRMGLPRRGGNVTLYTDAGPQEFPVAGIYYDYASSQGTVTLALDQYRDLWKDDALTALALRLSPDAEISTVVARLEERLAPLQQLFVRPNQALRKEALVVFDRTFAITSALQLLATVVAFVGVLSALLSLQLDRQREIGVLRAIGLTARQLWAVVLLETGLMGSVAGLLAMPTGFVLSLILIYIINQRSFGWTLQMQAGPLPFVQALIIAVSAAFLAGIYPARRMGRMMTAEALRSE